MSRPRQTWFKLEASDNVTELANQLAAVAAKLPAGRLVSLGFDAEDGVAVLIGCVEESPNP